MCFSVKSKDGSLQITCPRPFIFENFSAGIRLSYIFSNSFFTLTNFTQRANSSVAVIRS